MEDYLAHSGTEASPDGQLLKEHLCHVAEIAGEFFKGFDAGSDGRQCGLYHDIGKYSDAFQLRVRGSAIKVDHSTAGALLMYKHRNIPAAICIAGHHGGLPDIGSRNDMEDSFMGRINRAQKDGLEDYSAWEREVPPPSVNGYAPGSPLDGYFYTKMLFSALTDADWLDTEAYYNNQVYIPRNDDIIALRYAIDDYISPFWNATTEINKRRTKILKAAIKHGSDAPGLFTFTAPTGGGKTIASMAFALHHAVQHDLKRVIYVIPYCSILEQARQIFENIFDRNNIIAHYSGVEFDYTEEAPDARAFSAQNWEAPIILTTAVQFFESLYSSKPGKNRKLHNIADSVIVFDEAQMLPVSFLRPCIAGIGKLVEKFRCSAVLCTATQPAVGQIFSELVPELRFREICPEPEKMYQDFRRVHYKTTGSLSDEQLSDCLRQQAQVLCIVNSRRQAQNLYALLSGEDGVFHLSTTMIPEDRKRVLFTIRKRLQEGRKCRVVSTSLIEAGVDIDFPVVYRAVAGLDSIIQAGGRCNREGRRLRDESFVNVFRTDEKAPRMLEQNIAAAERILQRYDEIDSPEAIHDYFQFLLYSLKDPKQLDKKDIIDSASKMKFATVARDFHMIDGDECMIYIPKDKGTDLSEQLRQKEISRHFMRDLDNYGVNVSRKLFDDYMRHGKIERISDTAGILTDLSLYSSETGLQFELPGSGEGIFI